MPISAALDHQKQVFRTTITGVVTIGDMARHISAVRRTGAYRYPGIIDARGVERLSFSRRDLTNFIHHMRSILGGGQPAPRAIVVENLTHFAMARFVASLVIAWMRVGVFDDMASAEDWLEAATRVPDPGQVGASALVSPPLTAHRPHP